MRGLEVVSGRGIYHDFTKRAQETPKYRSMTAENCRLSLFYVGLEWVLVLLLFLYARAMLNKWKHLETLQHNATTRDIGDPSPLSPRVETAYRFSLLELD